MMRTVAKDWDPNVSMSWGVSQLMVFWFTTRPRTEAIPIV